MSGTTVVIPAYNSKDTLPRAMVSALTQVTPRRYEVLVVDDGSREPLHSSLERSLIKDPRVSFYRQANNGVAGAMNLGCSLAKGRVIIRLDSDDELTPDAVDGMTRVFSGPSTLVYTYSDCFWIGKLIGFKWESRPPNNPNPDEHVHKWVKPEFNGDLLLEDMYLGAARAFRKDVFASTDGYDESLRVGEDWDFALKMSEKGPIARVPKFLYKIHYQDTGLTETIHQVDNVEREKMIRKVVGGAIKRRSLKGDQIPGAVRKMLKLK